MSHHYSGPDFGFPLGDARLDLTDIYAFPAPGDAARSVLILNAHPSSTVIKPEPTSAEPFAANALYELDIDTNGDGIAEIAYRVRFSCTAAGDQVASLSRIAAPDTQGLPGTEQTLIVQAAVSTGRDALVTKMGEYRFFAGWRSEPFFFDTLGALDDLRFTGSDFFADKDVCSIVLEMPNSELGSGAVGIWGRILAGVDGQWVQVERGARPQQAVFLPGAEKEAYLAGQPVDDARFVPVFAHALEHTGGYSPVEAARVAEGLLPDVLRYDPALPACFPNNGRALTDDAADTFMAILTNGKIAGDGVNHHKDLLDVFPYVAPPHRG